MSEIFEYRTSFKQEIGEYNFFCFSPIGSLEDTKKIKEILLTNDIKDVRIQQREGSVWYNV